jgi:signal peptidase I
MGTRLAVVVARAMIGTVLVLLVLATLPVLFGWRSDVILSGSMLPGIAPGDVVVSRPAAAAQVEAGQVVLVDNPARPGTTLVHRAVRRESDGSLITQGDANAAPDSTPVPPAMVRGLPRLRIPYVGLPVLWVGNRQYGPLVALVVVAGLLLRVRGTRPRRRRRHVL